MERGETKHSHNKSEWIHAHNPDENKLKEYSIDYNIPMQYLHDAIDEEEKPKVYTVNDNLLVVVRAPYEEAEFTETISIGFFLTKKGMLSFSTKTVTSVHNILKEKELVNEYLKKGPIFLLYRILDAIGDSYFKTIDSIDEDLDKIEKSIFGNGSKNSVKKLYKLKKTLIYFHKSLSNNRDVVSSLANGQNLSAKEAKLYLVLKEEIMQMLDMITLYREITATSMDMYMTNISNNLNQVMKRLTAGASLILVPTFITGLYGMNFEYLPEIYWKYGYLFAWGLILSSILVLWIYFKKNDYF